MVISYEWRTHGARMAHAWRTHGARMTNAWRTHGARMAHAWRTHGARMGHASCLGQERAKVGDNNGQAMHGACKPPGPKAICLLLPDD